MDELVVKFIVILPNQIHFILRTTTKRSLLLCSRSTCVLNLTDFDNLSRVHPTRDCTFTIINKANKYFIQACNSRPQSWLVLLSVLTVTSEQESLDLRREGVSSEGAYFIGGMTFLRTHSGQQQQQIRLQFIAQPSQIFQNFTTLFIICLSKGMSLIGCKIYQDNTCGHYFQLWMISRYLFKISGGDRRRK